MSAKFGNLPDEVVRETRTHGAERSRFALNADTATAFERRNGVVMRWLLVTTPLGVHVQRSAFCALLYAPSSISFRMKYVISIAVVRALWRRLAPAPWPPSVTSKKR